MLGRRKRRQQVLHLWRPILSRFAFNHLHVFIVNLVKEIYKLTGEVLGQGAYASVQTCINMYTKVEYAVKIIDKVPGHSRARVFKEIDLFYHCQGHKNIIQLVEYFEQYDKFFLVFEKINGGRLLDHIQRK